MKRPVTSLCRRPGKKDRLRGSLSLMREQFPPIETLCGGQAELPGKSRPDEGSKTAPGGGRELCADCAHGRAAGIGVLVPGRRRTGHTPGQRARSGTKTVPGEGRGLCAGCAHGRAADIVCGVVSGKHHTGRTPGQRAHPGAKTAPGGGRRLSGCGIWVLLAPGDPCDLDAQGGQHSQTEDHAQLSQGEICHQEQAMQSGDQQHSQEQQHAHAEGSQ